MRGGFPAELLFERAPAAARKKQFPRLQADVELANSRVSIIFSYYKLLYLAGII